MKAIDEMTRAELLNEIDALARLDLEGVLKREAAILDKRLNHLILTSAASRAESGSEEEEFWRFMEAYCGLFDPKGTAASHFAIMSEESDYDPSRWHDEIWLYADRLEYLADLDLNVFAEKRRENQSAFAYRCLATTHF